MINYFNKYLHGYKSYTKTKEISGNRQSLYLDFYPAIQHVKSGKPTRREFLGLYIYEKTKEPTGKQYNKEQLQLAEQIRRKRENHLNKLEAYTGYELEQVKKAENGKQDFVAYFKNYQINVKHQTMITGFLPIIIL